MGRTSSGPRLVRIDGRRKWYIRWTERGRSRLKSTGCERRPDAERFLAEFNTARERGHRPTVGQLIDAYMDARAHLASHARMKYFVKRPKAEFGDLFPEDVTDLRVGQYIQKHGSRTMTRRELEIVGAAIGRNLPRPAKRPPRERYLTPEEGQKLYDAAKVLHMRLFILIALHTGRRAGAILDLTWDRVDLERGILDFRNPDKGETQKRRGTCRVGEGVVAALRDARQFARSGYVIEYRGRPVTRIWNGFKGVAERAGVPWAHPHLLKHSFISWRAEQGFTVDQIADFTDTTRETIWRIYRKVNPASQQPIVDAIGDYLASPVVMDDNSKGDKHLRQKNKSSD